MQISHSRARNHSWCRDLDKMVEILQVIRQVNFTEINFLCFDLNAVKVCSQWIRFFETMKPVSLSKPG